MQAARSLRQHAKSCLGGLAFSKNWMEARQEKAERDAVLEMVQATSKRFREVPEVRELEKQCTYDIHIRIPDRFKFLVLSGPSKLGNTRYVQGALVANPNQALILDCADAVIPALKDNFVRGEHKLIMYDEAHAEMIIRCKKVFQSGINYVQIGSSPTNCFLQTFYLHAVKMVIGSNTWTQELAKLADDDREWIKENSVHVIIDSALWIA